MDLAEWLPNQSHKKAHTTTTTTAGIARGEIAKLQPARFRHVLFFLSQQGFELIFSLRLINSLLHIIFCA